MNSKNLMKIYTNLSQIYFDSKYCLIGNQCFNYTLDLKIMKNYFVILSYLIFLMTKYDHIIGVNFFDIMVEHHIIIHNFLDDTSRFYIKISSIFL